MTAADYAAIQAELATRSFEHWARLRFRIITKREQDAPLNMNSAQRLVYDAEERLMREKGEVRLFVLKGRQGGISTLEQARALHTASTMFGSSSLTLADDGDNTEKIFGITQYAISQMPQIQTELGDRRTHELAFPSMSSRFYTGTAGGKRIGHSLRLRRLHASEFAFYDQPRTTLNRITPALIPKGSVVVLETTAGGFDSEAHQFWREAREGRNSYTTLFIPWWLCDVENYRTALDEPDELGALTKEESALVTGHGLTLEHIKWRRAKIRDMGTDEFTQHYAEDDESCWLSVGGMYYSATEIRALLALAPAPISDDGELAIYAHANGEDVIIGADTAEGVGQDRSTFTARAFPSWRLLRRFASSRIQPKEFAWLLNEQGRTIPDNGMPAFQVVEKNMHGITVLRGLRDDHDYPVGRIYHREPLDQAVAQRSERIGWATTAESKPLMLAAGRDLIDAAKEGHVGTPSKEALQDALGVRREATGRFNLTGKDVLVSEMLCWIGRAVPQPSRGLLDWMRAQATAAA